MNNVYLLTKLLLLLISSAHVQGIGQQYAIRPRPSPLQYTERLNSATIRPQSTNEAQIMPVDTIFPTSSLPPVFKRTPSPLVAAASLSSSPASIAVSSSTTLADPAVLTAPPIASSSQTPSHDVANFAGGGLPIKPALTPGIAVAGTVLVLTGLLYTLIGVKNKGIYVFFSTAYLTSLATTLLIIRVMDCPISNAIQGAYFIAALMPGLIFGAGSLFCADIAESLGCLLGGFALAMWFLVLRPDGLIHSTAGKAIFITCLTFGALGSYFSRWTRVHVLVGSNSFAGATVVVLGLDCYSRAGLKEFWLYLWGTYYFTLVHRPSSHLLIFLDLNEGLFPPHYGGPYPMTLGIRVEIAAIIIISLLGIISQTDAWKIFLRRRPRSSAHHASKLPLQDQIEDSPGSIEEANSPRRPLWDDVYDGTHSPSQSPYTKLGMKAPNVSKASFSIIATDEVISLRPRSIEMSDLEHAAANSTHDDPGTGDVNGKRRALVTVHSTPDEEVDENTPALTSTNDEECPPVVPPKDPQYKRHSSIVESRSWLKSGDDKIPSPIARAHTKNKPSISSIRFTPSHRRSHSSTILTSPSSEALVPPNNDDIGTEQIPSAFAATDLTYNRSSSLYPAPDDDISSIHASEADGTTLAGLPSPDADPNMTMKFSPPMEPHPADRPDRKISSMSLGKALDSSLPEEEGENSHEPVKDTQGPQNADTTITPYPPMTDSDPVDDNNLASLTDTPTSTPTSRTNEWTQTLSTAEKPSLDTLSLHHHPSTTSTKDYEIEKPAPLNIHALQQTPLTATPLPVLPLTTSHEYNIIHPLQPQEPASSPQQQGKLNSPLPIPPKRNPERRNFSYPNPIPPQNKPTVHARHISPPPSNNTGLHRSFYSSPPPLLPKNSLHYHRQQLARRTYPQPPAPPPAPPAQQQQQQQQQSKLNLPPRPIDRNRARHVSDPVTGGGSTQGPYPLLVPQQRQQQQRVRASSSATTTSDEAWRRDGRGMEERHREGIRRMQMGARMS
ncbi:MAG: hypothetical protein Q9220_007478 [cf. Caloplaca sp. 1 TL-2023]